MSIALKVSSVVFLCQLRPTFKGNFGANTCFQFVFVCHLEKRRLIALKVSALQLLPFLNALQKDFEETDI